MWKRIEQSVQSYKQHLFGRTVVNYGLTGLFVCLIMLSQIMLFEQHPLQGTSPILGSQSGPATAREHYQYYVIRRAEGFALARARLGSDRKPVGEPREVASFSDAFGTAPTDNIVNLQLSPDNAYLAIDGTRSDCELVWIFNTHTLSMKLMPENASGSFLHWLPGSSENFLFRPMFPRGYSSTTANNNWNPGLWKVNALTGAPTSIDIHMSSAFLIDAAISPDGSRIIYSTSEGVGRGSTIWSMQGNGQGRTRLLQLTDTPQSIAGFFSWSPDGHMITYERLADSPTPYLPAGLWVMNNQGQDQRYLAQTDGGHGYAPAWSPDGHKIAFVARTNPQTSQADQLVQALTSAIEVVDLASGSVQLIAGPVQTGVQISTNPLWSPDSHSLTFVAFNPLNPLTGGVVRYWSASLNATGIQPAIAPLSPRLEHIIAAG